MTEHDAQQLESLIDRMTDVERRDRLDRSVTGRGRTSPANAVMTAEQKTRPTAAFREIADLPLEGPGRFSGEDHDDVLYGADSSKLGGDRLTT